jgi:hypothetical protein
MNKDKEDPWREKLEKYCLGFLVKLEKFFFMVNIN